MKGIEIVTKYGLIAEKAKWDVEDFEYNSICETFSENDKNLIIAMDQVGDGEMSGMGMLLILHKLALQDADKYMPIFYEVFMFTSYVLIYEEFRHGLFLKELVAAVRGEPPFKNTVTSEKMAQEYINMESPWGNPYEAVVSFLLGEVTNTVVYREASKAAESEWLKEKFMNISRDEARHKAAWRDLAKKVCEYSEESKREFIEAFRTKHMIHQSEVNIGYGESVNKTHHLFSFAIMREVHEDKIKLLNHIAGDTDIDTNQILIDHINHIKGLCHA
jgi:hypothetical protein